MKLQGSGQGALIFDNAAIGIDEILAGIGRKRAYAASVSQTSSAGNFAVAEFNNPNGSGKTAYFFLGDFFSPTATAIIQLVFDGTTIAPAGVPQPLFAGGPASALVFGGANPAAITGTVFKRGPSSAANILTSLPGWFWCALPPNHNLQFQTSAISQQVVCNVQWIELSN